MQDALPAPSSDDDFCGDAYRCTRGSIPSRSGPAVATSRVPWWRTAAMWLKAQLVGFSRRHICEVAGAGDLCCWCGDPICDGDPVEAAGEWRGHADCFRPRGR